MDLEVLVLKFEVIEEMDDPKAVSTRMDSTTTYMQCSKWFSIFVYSKARIMTAE